MQATLITPSPDYMLVFKIFKFLQIELLAIQVSKQYESYSSPSGLPLKLPSVIP